jgi:ferritin-like metal-binding protein YciE
MTKLNDLHSLFIHELKDIYSAEQQITKALPKMAKAAENEDLRTIFNDHLEETRNQIKRLEKVFEKVETKPGGVKCVAMEGLLNEGKEILGQDAAPEILDAALICAAQRVEHYEIAGYGCARALAEQLGLSDIASELQATLEEEKNADRMLNELALGHVNEEAMACSR